MTFSALVDLDGTLTDPRPGIVGSVQYALEALGLTVPPGDALLWVIGPPLRQSFPQLGVPEARVEEAMRLYREHYYNGGAMFDAVVYPGVPEALRQIRAEGIRLIVATSKPHVMARPILAHFRLDMLFEAIHGAELDGRNDDKRDLIAHIIATEGVQPDRAVMIGDRLHDIRGAKHHAMASIGVTWGYGGRDELIAAGADRLCDAPSELASALAGFAHRP